MIYSSLLMACCDCVTNDFIDLNVISSDADKLKIFSALKIYWDRTCHAPDCKELT